MSSAGLFCIASAVVLPGLLLLVLLPKWKYTFAIIRLGIVLLLSMVYTYLIIVNIHTLKPDSFNSLENVKLLFSNDKTLVAGWIHYLAFDLMIGSWVVQKAIERNLPHTITIFILPAVFMFGPMGYLLFQIVLFLKTKLYGATLH
jgi:hypothetical protein